MRCSVVALLLVAGLAVADSCAKHRARAPRESAAGQQKGALRMQLTIKPRRTEVIVGESLTVEVRLVNQLAAVADVPSPDSPSVFEYILRTAKDGEPRYSLTRRFALAARSDDTMPTEPIETVKLNPGAALTYEEDIAGYAVTPIPVGQYLLSVAYQAAGGRVESAGVPLSVVAPRVRALATISGPSGRLGLAMLHDAGGAVRVYQREGRGEAPADGVWYERADSPAAAGAAVAAELGDHRGVRWFGWLRGEEVVAGVAQNQTLFLLTNPLPLGLRTPALQSVGWQPTREAAIFAALGADAQGRVTLALATLEDTGRGSVKAVPLGFNGLPARWAVRPSAPDLTRYDVVTAQQDGAAVRLQRQAVSASSGKVEAAVALTEQRAPLAALALPPLPDGGGTVDVLFGPAGDNGQMTYLRLPLGGGPPVAEWKFVAPADDNRQRPAVWALAPTPVANPAVLAKLGDRLVVRRAAGGGWKTFAEGAGRAEHLRLEVIAEKVWAVWADPVTGITYKLVE